MSDYLRIPADFFEQKEILILESSEDGYLYTDIFLKLCVKAAKTNGTIKLFEDDFYYTQALAVMTRHDQDTINEALCVFIDLGLIEADSTTLTILMLKKTDTHSKE